MDEICRTCGHSQGGSGGSIYHWCNELDCACPNFTQQPKSPFRKRRVDYCANCGIGWLAHPQAMEDPEAISSGCDNFLSEAVANA